MASNIGTIVTVGLEVGSNTATAGLDISENPNNPEKVTSSVVGALGNIAIGLTTGPIIAIVQITFALIDALFNPFKAYFNKDLKDLKKTIDEQINVAFLSNGYGFPLEVKPDITPQNDDEWKAFNDLQRKYYDDHGFITKDDVLEEEYLITELRKMKRYERATVNPYFENQNLLSGTTQNIALLIAAAAAKKKGYKKPQRPKLLMDYSKYKPKPKRNPPSYNLFNNDWQIIVIILLILISSSFSLFSIYNLT